MNDFIPDDKFIPDDQPTRSVSSQGTDFISDSEFVSDEDKYGGTVGAIKAGLLSFARGTSFGLSDEFLVQTGLMKPEDIKGFKETNPRASGEGEFLSIPAALIAPEVGLLGALSAPVKGAAKLGSTVAKASKIPASSTLGKIVSEGAALGLGSAVEGAAYGLGQTISEHALGDPDLNAEKFISNIGTSAVIGGALGSAFGALKGGIQAKFPKFLSEVDANKINKGDFEAIVKNSDLPKSKKEGFFSGLAKQKSNAKEIKEAADRLGAPVLPSMLSDAETVQAGQSALLKGPPTISSIKAQSIAAEGIEAVEKSLSGILTKADDITKANLGDTLKRIVTENVEAQSKPIGELYNEIKQSFEAIPVSEKSIKQISRNIINLEDVPFSPQAKAIAESAAERVSNLKTVDDIKRLKSILNQELGLAATPIQKRITSVIAEKLANLEENTIVRFAENNMKSVKAKDKVLSLLEQRKLANAQYKQFKSKLDEIGAALGKKKIHGAQDFIDFIDDLTPEKVADKLSNKNNSQFLEFFSKEMPEGMQAISGYQKSQLFEKSLKDNKLQINKVISEIDKMPKEFKEKVFSASELEKIKDIKTYMDAFPKNFNPSNTANLSAFRAFFESPIGASIANARDFAIEGFLKAASQGGDEIGSYIDGLTKIERAAIDTSKSIKTGVKEIFDIDKYGTPGKIFFDVTPQDKDHDKTFARISDFSSNPEKLIDHLNENTQMITRFAPNTAQALQATSARAISFLSEKLPSNGIQKKPLSDPYKPSKAELSKWYQYFNVVEKPTSALRQVAIGTLSKETMETLQVVYPKLLTEMQSQVMDKLTESMAKKKAIPYKTKLMLSMFLGQDLVSSLDPMSIMATQNVLTTATQQKNLREASQFAGANKGSKGKITESNRFLTPMQKSAQRKDE